MAFGQDVLRGKGRKEGGGICGFHAPNHINFVSGRLFLPLLLVRRKLNALFLAALIDSTFGGRERKKVIQVVVLLDRKTKPFFIASIWFNMLRCLV